MERRGAVLSIRDVCVSYDGHRVLDAINFDLPHGDFVGIVGPNGGGKTTLLRTILGLVEPECGEIRLFDTPLRRFQDHVRVGYVPQHVVHVDPRFPATVNEVVLLGRVGRRGLFRRYTADDREAVHKALEEVHVTDLAERRIGTLSGGQRQRVFLAKALAAEPDLLILDEPTTGVDPKARDDFYRLLDHLNHDHDMTILLVSHDTQAISLVAHRMIAVNRSLVYDGDPKAFEAKGGFGAAYGIHVHHHAEGPH